MVAVTETSLEEQIVRFIASNNGAPVTSYAIMRNFGLHDTEGTPRTRALIKTAMREAGITLGIPIGADHRGYFLLSTPEEFFNYMTNLDNRMDGIRERQDICRKAWDQRKRLQEPGNE